MSEPTLVDKWLMATLNVAGLLAHAPGGVHSENAPPGTAYPFVRFSLQDADDVKTIGVGRILVDVTYLVMVVGEGASYVSLNDAYDHVDDLLNGKTAPVTGGAIIWCERERPIRYPETTEGREYRHLGGLYRIQVREE